MNLMMNLMMLAILAGLILILLALSLGYLQVARERRMWLEIAHIVGVIRAEDIPDGDYEHGRWLGHVGAMELHLIYRTVGPEEQERYYYLFDSHHMPIKFTTVDGKISPT